MATLSLSIRLLRDGATVDDAVRRDSGLREIDAEGARLFVSQAPPTPPRWMAFVGAFSREPLERLQTMSCGAILFLSGQVAPEGEGHDPELEDISFTCAVTFGTAHHGLDAEAFERSFGLRVVLNAVSRSNLRSLDTATLDSTTIQRRIQTSRNADLQTFGMDIDRDLLRLAAGAPTDRDFASQLAGKDALTVHKRLEANELLDCCARAVTLYRRSDYRRDFAFIDHVVPVRDRSLVEALDALAFEEIVALVGGETSDLHLAIPEIFAPEAHHDVGYYGAGFRPGAKRAFGAVDIDDYISELRAGNIEAIENMAALRASHEICAIVDGEPNRRIKRRVYNCLVYEAEHDEKLYVLFDGSWFEVDGRFHQIVERDFQRLVAVPFVAQTEAANERIFIAELNAHQNLLNLDQVKLAPAGAGGANIEPCDFLSRQREFIHLKDGNGSDTISHLWNQGLVAIEAFVRDPEYRGALRAAVQRRQREHARAGFDTLLPNRRNRPIPAEFPIIYGILRKPNGRSGAMTLPFFSKVSLRSVASRIDTMGFPVAVHLIRKIRAVGDDA